jgi:hypothetical protein
MQIQMNLNFLVPTMMEKTKPQATQPTARLVNFGSLFLKADEEEKRKLMMYTVYLIYLSFSYVYPLTASNYRCTRGRANALSLGRVQLHIL